jgi:branched-chain amino acid transport system substrate-binding protein
MKIRLNKTMVAVASSALLLAAIPVAGIAESASATNPTYIVGFEGPLTGSLNFLGQAAVYGVDLAITQANASMHLPFTVQSINPQSPASGTTYDDQCDPSLSPTEATAAVAQAGLIAIVGPECSGATRAAYPAYSAAHIATVSPSATAAALTTGKTNNTFMRVVPGDDVQGAADAKFVVKTKGAKKVYVLNDASYYGAGLAAVFNTAAKANGAKTITATLPTSNACNGTASTGQFASTATLIKSSKATAVYYGGYYCDFGQLLNALHNAHYTGVIMSGDGSEDPGLLTSVTSPSYAKNVYLSIAGGSSTLPTWFLSDYNAQSGAPDAASAPYASQAYDATIMIITAMKQAYTSGISDSAFRAAVVTKLHALTYNGLTGVIKFQTNGNLTRSSIINFYQVKSGQTGAGTTGGYGIKLISHS